MNHVLTASECGRVSAVAGQAQREMRQWAAAYPGLFTAKPFDSALFGTLAMASAFSGPWLTAAGLRMANRVCLWCFGLDWLVDYVATSPEEVREIVGRCLAVADGAPPDPGDELACFLADIREELASAPAFTALRPVWRDDLRRMLDAMALESEWKAGLSGGVTPPTFEEYLGNADNLGFSFVFDSHWIFTAEAPPPGDVDGVRAASRAVQRVIRLLNDIGTYDRDVSWGDLNALMLGVTRDDLDKRLAALADRCRELIGPLRPAHPDLAAYLERQMDFCAGFYQVADYWGAL
jgi:hypothetical protein